MTQISPTTIKPGAQNNEPKLLSLSKQISILEHSSTQIFSSVSYSLNSIFIRILYFSQGLKTGMYYLRTKAAASAIKFTVDKTKLQSQARNKQAENSEAEANKAALICSLENKDDCLMCGS